MELIYNVSTKCITEWTNFNELFDEKKKRAYHIILFRSRGFDDFGDANLLTPLIPIPLHVNTLSKSISDLDKL